MREKKEIEAEVKKLEEMKPRVPPRTFFHDDNHAAIDAQIEVLKGEVDVDEIENMAESGEWTDHERSNAMQALDWMEENNDDPSPSEGWSELVS